MRQAAVALIVAVSALPMAGPTASAQTPWPSKEVRVVVPFPGGSAPDIIARQLAEKLRVVWTQPVVVENVPGASGTIGVGRVAKAMPDGYTLVMSADAAIVVAPSLFKQLAYDPSKDLTPITQIGRTPNILVVNAEKGPKSLQDLVAQAKANPGTLTFNSVGYGTSQHIGIERLERMAGIKVLHAPKNGLTAPEILAGQVTATFLNVATALPHIKQGTMRALGVSGLQRVTVAPEIPTIAEQGYPGFDAVAWFGLLAPAGTPTAVVSKINGDVVRILSNPELRSKLTQLGLQISEDHSPEAFAALIRADIPRYAELLKSSGIRLD